MAQTHSHSKLSTTSREDSASPWLSAIMRSSLPATARQVALTISFHTGEENSVRVLTEETGLSEHTVRSALKALREAGFLVVAKPAGWETVRAGGRETRVSCAAIYAPAMPEPAGR